MRQLIATACVLAIISVGSWAQQSGAPVTTQKPGVAHQGSVAARKVVKKKSAAHRRKKRAAAPQLPAQLVPPVPATLMNSAPVKPQVTLKDGLLTIDAPNSTLSDVLSGIHAATGASIEGTAPVERVAVKLGPGDPRQVIRALLQGTPYDYVILGSQSSPDAVTRVLLTRSSPSSAPEATPSAAAGQPANHHEEDNTGNENASPPEAEEVPQQPPRPPVPPRMQNQPDQNQNQAEQNQNQQNQDQNQPKSQDQLLRQLQNLGLAPVTPQQQPPQPQQPQ